MAIGHPRGHAQKATEYLSLESGEGYALQRELWEPAACNIL